MSGVDSSSRLKSDTQKADFKILHSLYNSPAQRTAYIYGLFGQ